MKVMPEEKPLAVDLLEADALSQIFPCSSVASSHPIAWSGLIVEHHRQPAWETPEHCLIQHVISINIGSVSKIERVVNGRLQQERFLNGNVGIYPARVSETLRWDKDAEFILLSLDPDLLNRTASESFDKDSVELVAHLSTRDPLIQGMGLALKVELESGGFGGRLYVESMANALSMHLLRHYWVWKQPVRNYTNGLPKFKLHQATDYINDNLEQDLTLAEIAAVVQISPFHFARMFKQSTGVAPHQYVVQCRVERAKQLLLQGKMAIADIAVEVGFANQSHLNRHFKRLVGVTPKTILESSKNVSKPART